MLLVSFLLRLSSFLHYPFSFRLPPFTCLLSPSSFHLPLSSILLFPSSFPRPPFPLPLSSARSPLPASPLSFLITICWFCPPRFSLSLSLSLSRARGFRSPDRSCDEGGGGHPGLRVRRGDPQDQRRGVPGLPPRLRPHGALRHEEPAQQGRASALQQVQRPARRPTDEPVDRPTDRSTYRPIDLPTGAHPRLVFCPCHPSSGKPFGPEV